jgi:hypothetical protein
MFRSQAHSLVWLKEFSMLTFFTTAKPFLGDNAMIQRNALKSWTLLHVDVEVILFGDDAGAAEAARELGIRHVPEVERVVFKAGFANTNPATRSKAGFASTNPATRGPKILRSFFDAAQRMARHEILCYANCDIIFTRDFLEAVCAVRAAYDRFLMVGRRWDTEIDRAVAFGRADWAKEVRALARQSARQCNSDWVDYFVFHRGLYLDQLPAFVIGRVVWDHWLVWKARSSGLPIVDASDGVMAIHQNHDYSYHPAGREGVWTDELAVRNQALAGSRWHLCSIDDATHLVGPSGVRENPRRRRQALRRWVHNFRDTLRYGVLNWSRPLRHAIGLQKKRTGPATANAPDFAAAGHHRAGSEQFIGAK